MRKIVIIAILAITGAVATSCADESENILPDLNSSDAATATEGTGGSQAPDRD